jgi:glycosyltransferase involved in cell wall biosynthesis
MSVECVLIARDNADTISAAIASVAAHVDAVLVVLNAESDEETGAVARAAGARVVRGGPFRDFASARNEALEYVHAEWALQLDTDDAYAFGPEFQGWPTDGEAHAIVTVCEGLAWKFIRLFRPHLRYREKCHEYISCDVAPLVFGVNYLRTPPKDPVARARRNAALLEGQTDSRSVFQLGMAHMQMGNLERALEFLEQRATMPDHPEETFYATLEAARIYARLARPNAAASAYVRASLMRPTRAEPYVECAKILRERGDVAAARDLARRATELPPCTDMIFVDIAAHTWRPWAELALTEKLLGDEAAFEAAYSKMVEWRRDAPPLTGRSF